MMRGLGCRGGVDGGNVPWCRLVLDVVEVAVCARVSQALAVVHAHADTASNQSKLGAFDPCAVRVQSMACYTSQEERTHISGSSSGPPP